ncbi:MAG: bifunctional oligoribonuclease/PAP phosphatase NrnA [Candidatus Eisenbacteria bacterium]
MEKAYRTISDLIRSSESFLITSHIDPDGDAIGSALAIFSVLTRLGKSCKVVFEEPIPQTFDFLKGSDEVITSSTGPCEVAIVVDAADLDRVGWVKDVVAKCPVIVNIDHHGSNDGFGHHNLVVTSAGACGEIVYKLLTGLVDTLILGEAEALYVAILSDTGCFRFPTTSADTLRTAASLIDIGVRPYHAASEIFWKRSPSALKLLSGALSTIEVTNDGAVATMEITRRMFTESGATPKEIEGFANYPRSIRDVLVGVFVREMRDGMFRVSLRAREGYRVDQVAKTFGGGGHPTAAGFRIRGDIDDLKARLRSEIQTTVLNPNSTSD